MHIYAGKKLDVTYVSKEELDAQIAAAPNPFASFIDLLLRAIADGWWVPVRDNGAGAVGRWVSAKDSE
jgi:hypothetical protein